MAAIFPPPPTFQPGLSSTLLRFENPSWLSSFQLDLWTDNCTLRHSTLFISSLPPLSFFIFPYRSGLVSPRATETPRSCLEESALFLHIEPCSRYRFDRVTTVLAPSYKSRGHEPPCSTVNFGPRDRRPPSPIVSINEIYVTDARDPKDLPFERREGMLFVERESRKCAKLFIINSTKFLNVKAQEIARNDIYDNRKEGWKEGGGDLSRCTRTDFYEDYYEWRGGMETLASRREILKEEGNLNSCDVASLYRWFFNGSFESGSRIEKLMPPRTG